MKPERRAPQLGTTRAWATAVLGLLTGYLLLERSHAEEVGTGTRVVAEILRGERPLSPLTWLAFGLLALLLIVSGRDRVGAPVEAPHGR